MAVETPFYLYPGQKIQGDFVPKKINLALLFQLNCPGCFFYALPVFDALYTALRDTVGMIALSTAFENFSLNTTQNTLALVNHGTLVGHTKKLMYEHGYDKLHIQPEFPIAMDQKMNPSQLEEIVNNICRLHPEFNNLTKDHQKLAQVQVRNYLKSMPELSLTFTANQCKGTPTFVLFNDQNKLLASWFGNTKKEVILDKVNSFL